MFNAFRCLPGAGAGCREAHCGWGLKNQEEHESAGELILSYDIIMYSIVFLYILMYHLMYHLMSYEMRCFKLLYAMAMEGHHSCMSCKAWAVLGPRDPYVLAALESRCHIKSFTGPSPGSRSSKAPGPSTPTTSRHALQVRRLLFSRTRTFRHLIRYKPLKTGRFPCAGGSKRTKQTPKHSETLIIYKVLSPMSRLLPLALLGFAWHRAWQAPLRARPDEDAWREAYAAEKQRFELLVEPQPL